MSEYPLLGILGDDWWLRCSLRVIRGGLSVVVRCSRRVIRGGLSVVVLFASGRPLEFKVGGAKESQEV